MQRSLLSILLTALFLLPTIPAADAFTPEQIALVNRSIELTINHEYQQAMALFRGRVTDRDTYPDRFDAALGHFHLATIYASWMQDREDFAQLDSCEYHLVRCEELTDSLLKLRPDPDSRFLRAGCSLYRSYIARRQGRWWRMYREGMDGVNRLEKLAQDHPDFREVDLGLGNYLYWKSSLLEQFSWIPFIRDQRKEGIALLERGYRESRFGQWLAVSNLTWILMDYGETGKALQLARHGRAIFPESRHFLFPLGKAHLQLGETAVADSIYTLLLGMLQADSQPSRYNEFYCMEKLVFLKLEQGLHREADAYCDSALALPLAPEAAARLKDKRQELLEMKSERSGVKP